MSFDSSNNIIQRFDSFCRGIPIIPAIKAINNHQVKISESVLQIFDTPASKTTDVVANMVLEIHRESV